ncbi:hypothetical protein Mp_1g01420 [Marchantia polymorpha subsp. ruderalis]|uniref:Uncharacterized protein n=2 Tax=Marchantia polymorpha TaxID=3197 RepID=A0AAF6AKC6_MARPO|nr:hypothetical protein MARPO_0029s0106 [Marchantia polymorpha]BBM96896.1 hypothetical protein Mp_1g01420 [Marchantia polymorpha subsp. ruderalis]|eukprot:PTQ42587.1 hypothetical protein MARPO_0029s0106 [Marchantia polymorpha]
MSTIFHDVSPRLFILKTAGSSQIRKRNERRSPSKTTRRNRGENKSDLRYLRPTLLFYKTACADNASGKIKPAFPRKGKTTKPPITEDRIHLDSFDRTR